MKYLFWNTGRKQVNEVLERLIEELSCDVISLAEYTDDLDGLKQSLHNKGHEYHEIPTIGCERVTLLTRYAPSQIKHFNETAYYTIKQFPHESLGRHLIAFVHFPSKLHMRDEDYITEAAYLKRDIEDAEAKSNHSRTIVVGDFNMNPFESAMVTASAMHSLPSRSIASRNVRTVNRREYSMFYNPMWNLLGDIQDPPGTYYYGNSGHLCYFWNTFDQVIVRPSLLENFVTESVKIITEVQEIRLVNNNGIPCLSDHLPLYFEVS